MKTFSVISCYLLLFCAIFLVTPSSSCCGKTDDDHDYREEHHANKGKHEIHHRKSSNPKVVVNFYGGKYGEHQNWPFKRTRFPAKTTKRYHGNNGGNTCPPGYPALSACPEGWKQFENYCYKYFSRNGGTFEDGERNCQSYKGHMMSVHSKREEDFLEDYGNTDYPSALWVFMGAERLDALKNFGWIDGTPFDYTNYEVYLAATKAEGLGYFAQPTGNGIRLKIYLKPSGRRYLSGLFETYQTWDDAPWEHDPTNPNHYYGCKVCLKESATIMASDQASANKRIASATLYRAWNSDTTNHYFTADWQEMIKKITTEGYTKNELNVGNVVPTGSSVPSCPHLVNLYHIYNAKQTDNIWTTDKKERDKLLAAGGWTDQGITAQCSSIKGECGATRSLHRFNLRPWTEHFITADELEYNRPQDGTDEGIVCYIWS